MQRQLRNPIEEELSARHHQTGVLDLKVQPDYWAVGQTFNADYEDENGRDTTGGQLGVADKVAGVPADSNNNNNNNTVHEYWQTNRFGEPDDDDDDVDDDDGHDDAESENTNDEDRRSAKTSVASSSEREFAHLNELDFADTDLSKGSRDCVDDDDDIATRHHLHPVRQPEQIVMEVQQTLEQINEFVNMQQQQQQQQQNRNGLAQANSIQLDTASSEPVAKVGAKKSSSTPAANAINSTGSHKSNRRLYKCRHCPFETDKKIENWQHIRIHMRPEKLLCCESCQFVTEYKHHLEYHQRNHTGFKPFKCEHCDYQCVNKSMLNSHMKSHSTIYQFQCGDCKYATKYVHSLKMHLRKYSHQPAQLMIDIYGRKRGPKPGCGGRNSNASKQATSQSSSSAGNRSSMSSARAHGKSQASANQCVLDLRVESKLVH